ncbi:MAG TPA: ATP-binding protein [Candidatus Eisenbacteria bacterium]|jgi:PAS domain S-box-containing protein|nr:ATP-binding protein [Candidatus Eisenbacteria bacterium]
MSLAPKHRWGLAFGGVLLALLLAAVFTFGSLDVPFEPGNWRAAVTLYAVSSLITAALLVFGLILTRTVIRLWTESNKQHLGARFKTKMVVGAMGLSLLPVVFMFFVSYSLLNRTLGRWFPRPLEIASEETQGLITDFGRATLPRLRNLARQVQVNSRQSTEDLLKHAFESGLDAVWILDQDGKIERGGVVCDDQPEDRSGQICEHVGVTGIPVRTLPSGVEVWEAEGKDYLVARVGFVAAGYRTSPTFMARVAEIQKQTQDYEKVKQSLRALKRQMLLILVFFTMLLLFSVMWIALYLAKQVTVPIQALAEGTREVSSGNFDYQVPEQAQDELGILVRSFNTMVTQLRDSRAQIDQFTRNLQQAVQELERRRQLMETILENVPTGVVSLDAEGGILRENTAVTRMFGESAREIRSLEQLLGVEAARTVQLLMRRSLRMGVVSREIETVVAGRVLHLAVTVSSLGPRRANTGYVLVLDDLTEMLRAQKTAAWQEVARRIAHEIKNPLTPIQLSSQRLSRFLDRRDPTGSATPRDPELTRLVQECSRLIEREVSTLAALVNEFSQFVRFPIAKLVPTSANTIVHEAVEVFSGRLDGITLKTSLTENLPLVRADGGLLRSVVVNLIDNAAEALETAPVREIMVSTCAHGDAELVEISVQDTGHGISPEDKDRLFLPHFSTKDRGTGLGLAIAARIVAEHGGTIYVEDNFPVGSRFVVELPSAEPATAPVTERNGVEAS